MNRPDELGAVARAIIDANRYMTLGTADETGLPWVSPVWFAPSGYSEFLWVSSPEARHSRNLTARPELSIVVFDSQVPISTGQAVYMAARAEELADAELEHGIEVFSRRSQDHGAPAWTTEDVLAPAPLRLYLAVATEHWILDPDHRPDRRTPVTV